MPQEKVLEIQEFELSQDGLLANLIAFNVGVEIGQLLALSSILILMSIWRKFESFNAQAFLSNTVLMCVGFLLAGQQLVGYFLA